MRTAFSKKLTAAIASVLFLAVAAAGPVWAEEPLREVTPDAAWDAVFDRADGWIGGDAIYSTPLSGDEILWLFADTYVGHVRNRRRQPGTRIVNNSLARHPRPAAGAATDPATVRFLWGSPPDAETPRAWIELPAETQPPGQPAEWYWVADALAVDGVRSNAPPGQGSRLIVFLWRIARTDAKVIGFRGAGSALAIIDNPREAWSAWQPRQVTIAHARATSGDKPPAGGEVVWGSEVLLTYNAEENSARPYVLIFGYRQPQKLVMQLIAARAPAEAIDDMSTWRFRTADGWSEKLDDAATLADGITTELSISLASVGGRRRWVMIHSQPWLGDRILARTADTMFGPWSKPKAIYRVPDLNREKKHITYAAKAHPELSRPGELLVSYVVNSLDFGESATNAEIYRPRFIRVPLGVCLGE